MMSWIMYVVRSITCGRAVNTLLFPTSSPSCVSCFSNKPHRLEDEDEEEEEEEDREQARSHVLGSVADFLAVVQLFVGQSVSGLKGSAADRLHSLSEKMTLSIGCRKNPSVRQEVKTRG